MKKNKNNKELFIFILGFVFIVISISMFMKPSITGAFGSTGSAQVSNVTVSTTVLICQFNTSCNESADCFNNLTSGINFGTEDAGDADESADGNGDGYATNYSIYVNETNTVNVDLWIKANEDMLCSAPGGEDYCEVDVDILAVDGNYTWNDSTTPNGSTNEGEDLDACTDTSCYKKTGNSPWSPGTDAFFRFWLDIPALISAGDYNNTIYFKCNITS